MEVAFIPFYIELELKTIENTKHDSEKIILKLEYELELHPRSRIQAKIRKTKETDNLDFK
jgi:hypothetical protein